MRTLSIASLAAVLASSLTAQVQNPAPSKSAAGPAATGAINRQVSELTDEVILLAVENEMLRSEAVDGHALDVKVDGGLVTISGRVNNLLARQIAVGLAQRVRGVVSVINQIDVNYSPRPDSDLKKDVETALDADAGTHRLNIQVNAENGQVTLAGTVVSSGLRSLAGNVASSVKGVGRVHNNLKVASGRTVTDQELEKEIAELFKFSALLDDAHLTVSVRHGQAVLNGTVASDFQKSVSAEMATNAGASPVDNRGIKVSWRGTNPALRPQRYKNATDEQIRSAIMRAFKYDPRLLSFVPQVKVEKGVVTLTGDVGYLLAKEVAESDARHTIGVQRVRNNLRVRWSEDKGLTDEQIAGFARAALKRDAYVDRHNLIIQCRNAHVSLYGVVDTEFEKEHAEWTAGSQRGVVHVNNYLAVRKQWVPKSDAAILASLKDKLGWDFVDPNNQVTATVENGVAILRGTVDTWSMWQRANELAIDAGARVPHNIIQVRYGEPSAPHYFGSHYYIPE